MSSTAVLDSHSELLAARRTIAQADDKLLALQIEALRLKRLSDLGYISLFKLSADLFSVATNCGLCTTDSKSESVRHVIGMGLAGQSAGVRPAHSASDGTRTKPNALLRPLDLADFLKIDLPPRRLMLEPWLPEKAIGMVYAPRGVGKTLLLVSAAYAIGSGSQLLGWKAPDARRVVYVDGEMPAALMKHHLAAIVAGFSKRPRPNFSKS